MWRFNGEDYDLTEFQRVHPGGKWVIEGARGTDITYLIQTNHLWTKEQALRRLSKYRIKNEAQPAFCQEKKISITWDEQLQSIQQSLKRSGLNVVRSKVPTWGWAYYCVFGFIYLALWAKHCKLPSMPASAMLGVMGWLFAGFIQHEGGHSSLSTIA